MLRLSRLDKPARLAVLKLHFVKRSDSKLAIPDKSMGEAIVV